MDACMHPCMCQCGTSLRRGGRGGQDGQGRAGQGRSASRKGKSRGAQAGWVDGACVQQRAHLIGSGEVERWTEGNGRYPGVIVVVVVVVVAPNCGWR